VRYVHARDLGEVGVRPNKKDVQQAGPVSARPGFFMLSLSAATKEETIEK
jgi:hypothetical protein